MDTGDGHSPSDEFYALTEVRAGGVRAGVLALAITSKVVSSLEEWLSFSAERVAHLSNRWSAKHDWSLLWAH